MSTPSPWLVLWTKTIDALDRAKHIAAVVATMPPEELAADPVRERSDLCDPDSEC
jgi:hypothetical protein